MKQRKFIRLFHCQLFLLLTTTSTLFGWWASFKYICIEKQQQSQKNYYKDKQNRIKSFASASDWRISLILLFFFLINLKEYLLLLFLLSSCLILCIKYKTVAKEEKILKRIKRQSVINWSNSSKGRMYRIMLNECKSSFILHTYLLEISGLW